MSQSPPEEASQAGNSASFFPGAQNVNITASHFHVFQSSPPVQPSQAQPQSSTAHRYLARPRHVLYQEQMLHGGRGFPLWFPSPSLNLSKEYRLKGFSIGDVGYFTPEGGFEFLFNILRAAKHPINGSASDVPEGFIPHSPLNARDIRKNWDFESGAYMCGPSVQASRVESAGLTFRSTSSEGAILTMPKGACKTELNSTSSFQRYVSQHAESWYKFAHGPCGRNVANGELRLVYGCDKSIAWGMAAFSNTTNAELKFSKSQHRSDGESSYSWEHSEIAEAARVGPGGHDNKDVGRLGNPARNQCLFLRSMTVTLATHIWEGLGLGIRAEPMFQESTLSLSDQSLWSMDPATILGTEYVFRLLSGVNAVLHAAEASGSSEVAVPVNKVRMQDGRKPFLNDVSLMVVSHPSSIINKLLFRLYPTATMAITTDAAWQAILPQNWLLLTIDSLTKKLRIKKKAVYSEGLVYFDPLHGPLRPASNSSPSSSVITSRSTIIKSKIAQILPISKDFLQKAEQESKQGLLLYNNFQQTGDLNDIAAAIKHQEKAVMLTTEDDSDMPGYLNNLGLSFFERFEQMDNPSDIAAAIGHQEKAVMLSSEGDPNLPLHLHNLGHSFFSRFQQTHDLTDIATAIGHQEKAVKLTAKGDSDMPGYFNNLGVLFFQYFQQTHNLAHIITAIQHQEKAVRLTTEDSSNIVVRLYNLGLSLSVRFKQTHDFTDIIAAIRHQENAVKLTAEGDSDMPACLSNLGASFYKCFQQTHNLTDIAAAIKHQEKAVKLTSEGDPDLPQYLYNLGISFYIRFKQTHNFTDLTAAIRHQEKAVTLTSNGHSNKHLYLCNLTDCLSLSYELTGDQAHKSTAEKYKEQLKCLA